MTDVVIGTTPTFIFKFSKIQPSDIVKAVMTIKQSGNIIIERDLTTATVSEDSVSWTLTQEETLAAEIGTAEILLNWLDDNDTRGVSVKETLKFVRNHINEVMS